MPYFHLVFTLPHALNGLIARHPRMIYELLFAAASATLTEFAADPRHLGGEAAFTLVLHTWKQDLGRHVHVHALVAGGALAPGGAWMAPKRGFLFPVKALSRVFRGKFIAALQARWAADGWTMLGAPEWRRLRAALFAHDWVVYAKQPLGGPEQVLAYLGRYTYRVAISNERLVAMDGREVAFRLRADAGKPRTLRLAGEEFIRRFLLHVLPTGFKRIRHYGLLAPSRKASRLPTARDALGMPPPNPTVVESVADFMRRVARFDIAVCTCCHVGRMVTVGPLPVSHSLPPIPRGPP